MTEHRCPEDLSRTARARDTARAFDWLRDQGRKLPADNSYVVGYRRQIADNMAHFAAKGLCVACGYPLDGSAPHPEARPDWRSCKHFYRKDITQLGTEGEQYLCNDCGARVTVEPPTP